MALHLEGFIVAGVSADCPSARTCSILFCKGVKKLFAVFPLCGIGGFLSYFELCDAAIRILTILRPLSQWGIVFAKIWGKCVYFGRSGSRAARFYGGLERIDMYIFRPSIGADFALFWRDAADAFGALQPGECNAASARWERKRALISHGIRPEPDVAPAQWAALRRLPPGGVCGKSGNCAFRTSFRCAPSSICGVFPVPLRFPRGFAVREGASPCGGRATGNGCAATF